MKVEREYNARPPKFRPFKLVIDVESETEADVLAALTGSVPLDKFLNRVMGFDQGVGDITTKIFIAVDGFRSAKAYAANKALSNKFAEPAPIVNASAGVDYRPRVGGVESTPTTHCTCAACATLR